MSERREFLLGAAALATTIGLSRPALAQGAPGSGTARATAPTPQPGPVQWSSGTEAPRFHPPANATDCHHHIYDSKYPVAPNAVLTPPDASIAEYRKLQRRLGTTRNVIVQPSTYGTDNRVTLDAMKEMGPQTRAVAVVDTSVTDHELQRLHGLGVRGIRFNLQQAGATTLDMLEPLSTRVDALGWHCQINMPGEKILAAQDVFRRVSGTLVFDHLAQVPEPAGVDGPVFKLIRELIDKGNAWVKLSGVYITSKSGPPAYADAAAVAQAYVNFAPGRLVWGSDWPHPTAPAGEKPDDALLFDLFASWVPDPDTRNRILVDNPAELYDFPKG